MPKIHPYLESKRIQVDWKKCDPVHKGPRWIVVVADNVAMGWSDTKDEPRIEGYFTTYLIDAWLVYRYCSPEKLFQLHQIENVIFTREDVPDRERDDLEQSWCYGQDEDNPLVAVRDIERSDSPWVPVGTFDDDGECPEEDGYMCFVDDLIASERSSPFFC